MNALMLDSLEHEIEIRDKYFLDLNSVISGRQPIDRMTVRDSTRDYSSITFQRSVEDSALRSRVESEEQYTLGTGTTGSERGTGLASVHFLPPVKGIVSSDFDTRTRHFATDIVTQPKAVVSSVLDGTVIMTGWTMETGFVMIIQHSYNLISVYKHNATLLKEMGERVWAGELSLSSEIPASFTLQGRTCILSSGITGNRWIRRSIFSSNIRVSHA